MEVKLILLVYLSITESNAVPDGDTIESTAATKAQIASPGTTTSSHVTSIKGSHPYATYPISFRGPQWTSIKGDSKQPNPISRGHPVSVRSTGRHTANQYEISTQSKRGNPIMGKFLKLRVIGCEY